MKILTSYMNPPIPVRDCDWCAVDDSTYAGPDCPIGWGPTEADAIADLLQQIEPEAANGPQ